MVNYGVSSSERIRKMVYASLFASMTAVGAYMVIPIGPIPITLQVLFVFLAGAFLGCRWGMASMLVYLLIGIVGLPVFAGGAAGLGVLFGPTGGYLIGFVIAASVVGYLIERHENAPLVYVVFYFMVGLGVVYFAGSLQLMYVASLSTTQAFVLGVAPFIIPDAVTAVAGAILFTRVDTRL